MPDSVITFTPNLHLTKLPANYRVWAQIMNDNLTLLDSSINGFVQYTNLRGPWTNSTVYAVGDTVVDPLTAVLHTALVAHTSAQIPTTFAEDSLAHPTYWTLANAPASNRGVWTGPGTTYQVNDFVLANGLTYAMCTIQHVSGVSFDSDLLLGRWAVLIDLSIAGSQVLPILSGPADALKFVNTDAAGGAYEIVTGVTAMQRLEGILPVLKGGTGVNTSTGTGSNVLSTSPQFAGVPTTVTPPAVDNTPTIVNAEWVRLQNYMTSGAVSAIYAPLNNPNFNGVPTVPTPPPGSNNITIPNTAWVTAALAGGGASISVGTTPPGSPTANALWWNSDASAGGGQLYIYYNDGTGSLQWVPAAAGASAPTSPGGEITVVTSGTTALTPINTDVVVPFPTVQSGNSGSWWSTSTNRYTPPAGKHFLICSAYSLAGVSGASCLLRLRKNGTLLPGGMYNTAGNTAFAATTFGEYVDANGTDYFDWVMQANVAGAVINSAVFTAFPISGVKGPPGDPGVGLLQTVSYQTGAYASGTTLIPFDDTIPQQTEGVEFMTLAITPRSATSKLLVEVSVFLSNTAAAPQALIAALFQDSTASAIAVGIATYTTAGTMMNVSYKHSMTSGTTSATTFRVRCGTGGAGTIAINGAAGSRFFGGVYASSIVIQEVQ